MKTQFTISVFTENQTGLLNRVSVIFNRRHINIESITVSPSEIEGIHRFTIVISEIEENIRKVVKQLEKQVDVLKAFYHKNEEIVFQEIALFKVPTNLLASGGEVERIIRAHHARVLSVEQDYTIIEKTGHEDETQQLFEELKNYDLLEFVRSGRVAIAKPMKEFKQYLVEMEEAHETTNQL